MTYAMFLSLINSHPTIYLMAKVMMIASILFTTHYLIFIAGRKLTYNKPFIFNFLTHTFRITQLLLLFLAFRLGLSSMTLYEKKTPLLILGMNIGMITALTLFALKAVSSVSQTVITNHPFDITDNLRARSIVTQTRVLQKSLYFLIILLGIAFILLSLPGAKELGQSFLASAGIASLIVGVAARPVLSNFIAGLQLAFTQPLRLDDSLIIDGEWGIVEKITATYVVLKIWDERRMIIPLQWLIENHFQNWTYDGSNILGTVFLYLDFTAPIATIREKFEQICQQTPLWDKRLCQFQVTDFKEKTMQIRLLASARSASDSFNLRCIIREELIHFLANTYPDALPR